MKFCVIGLGETGVTIASLLASGFPNSELTIIDPADWISGRYLDVAHAASFSNVHMYLNDSSKASEADFFFYCAGVRNEKGEDRLSVIERNKEIIPLAFDGIQPKTTAKIIVVTNPVELITQWISIFFKEKITVVGTGTALDSFRLKYLMEQKKNILSVISVEVLGEHGASMVPVFSALKMDGESKADFFTEEEKIELHQELVQSATIIRKTEEATKFGVAECAIYIVKAFLSKETIRIPVSIAMSKFWKEKLDFSDDLFVSLSCQISENGISVIDEVNMNEKEWQLFRSSVEKLNKVAKSIKA